MYKTTFGPRIQYVLTFALVFLTLSSWTSGNLFAQEISITANTVFPSCSNNSDGSIDISVSGGTTPYSYSWSGPGVNSSTSQDLNNLGEGDYTVTVTDANSNSSNKTIILNFVDNIDPQVVTKNITVQLDATGNATIAEDAVNNGSSDACGGLTYDTDITSFDCSDVGANSVQLTVTDGNGNSATASATVTVEDKVAPEVITKNITVQLDASGNATIAEDAVNNGSSDACNGLTYDTDITSFDCSDVGANSVQLTVTDGNGNSTTASATVTVEDKVAPEVITKNITVQLDATGNVTIAEDAVNNGSSDACNGLTYDTDKTSFDCSDVGANTVQLTVTDGNGNSATVSATVTVEDKFAPEVITRNITVQLDATGNASIAEDAVNDGSSDACDGLTFDTDITSFDCSNVGANTVQLTVTDGNGNSATASATVTVEDKVAPEVITKNITVQLDATGNVTIAENAVNNGSSDACNGLTYDTDKTSFDCSDVGANTVQLTVTDGNGNSATASATVTVEDNLIPVLTAGDNINTTNDTGICEAGLSIAPATATDNCNVGSPIGTRDDGLGLDEPYPVGVTTISWSVTDANGNAADEVIQTVTVQDNEAPAPPVIEDITWGCEYTVEAPVAIDNCSGQITGTTSDPTTYSTAGTYSITWTFTDGAGNSSIASQEITIDPVIVNTTKVDVLCNGFATGEVEATATGGIAPLTYDWGSLGTGAKKTDLPAGTYTVTVTDSNGCESDPVSVTVEEPDTFIEITNVQTTSGCFGENNGTATITAEGGTGAYTYLWDNGQTTQTATGLAPGNHLVIITDENGCSKERTVTVSQPTELKITGFLTTETTSFGSATGTATAQVSGGTPSYSFAWTGGPTSINKTGQTARDLPAGTYTVTVTDSNGCTATEQVVIVDALSANIVPISLCKEGDLIRTSTFSVENGTAIGGTAPYTYSWDFGERANPATGSGVGPTDVTYDNIGDKLIILTVTDSEGREFEQRIIQYVGGCFADDCGSNDLGLDNYFIGDSSKNEITSANCDTVDEKFIYINFPTEATRYSLQIELIYSVEDIETGEINNYKVTDCFFNKQDIPKVAQTFSIDYDCGDIVKVEGIYLTFQNNDNRACGTTQGNGNNPKCFSTNNEATVSSPLFAVAFANELLCNGASNGTVTYRASGGSGNYSFDLIDSSGNSVEATALDGVFTEVSAGKYRVKVTDSDTGEVYTTKEVEITEPSNPLEVLSSSQSDVTCFGGSDGSATVEATGGTPDYIYVWEDGQTGQTATNLAAGTYEVRIIDANGCEIATSFTIEQPEELIANAGPDQVLGCGFSSTPLNASENLDENGDAISGQWAIVNGPSGGSFADDTDPKTTFTGGQGTYTLRWSVDCGKSDDVKVSFTSCSTLDFDGVDDHVNFADNYGFDSGSFTFEAWIKPKSTDGIRTILSKRDYSNPGTGYELILENGVPKINGIGATSFTDKNVSTNRWYHVAISFDGTTANLYVDGILLGTKSGASSPQLTTAPFLLGAVYDSSSPNNPKNLFHGWMEEVRLWGKSLEKEQIRLLMNQRITENAGKVRGEIIPIDATGITWTDLKGYYRLQPGEITGGYTADRATNKVNGRMINITTTQETTAPLPYISAKNGLWFDKTSWKRPQVWDAPNSVGINDEKINWNIAVTSHTLKSDYKDITLLGLLSESNSASKLDMQGSVNNETGNSLFISHYLKLNGVIDLNGESQLVQPENSTLEESSSGYLDRDQQGTANSFNYNYWTSPVSLKGTSNNSGFKIKEVLLDGTDPTTPKEIIFNYFFRWADGFYSGAKRISTYWLYTFGTPEDGFNGTADDYSEWHQFGETDLLPPGIGYSMKGTQGYLPLYYRQNYTFRGKPNNGNITVNVGAGQNLLIGNPYPSAIDSHLLIQDNLNDFNGSIYYWDHFGEENTHFLSEYIGGYAVYNLSGGVASASSVDSRINSNGDKSDQYPPGKYIPVGQAFFISTIGVSNPSSITFKNKHRAFVLESTSDSHFHAQEDLKSKKEQEQNTYKKDSRYKIRLKFESPKGYHRQILATADANTTDGFDLGYDAPLIENNVEDMYWIVDETEFVIQAVPDFNLDQVLKLGIKIAEPGEYTIKIDELENIYPGFNIYLKDLSTEEYYNLSKEDFTTNAEESGYFDDLYEIVFRKPHAEEPEKETPGIDLEDSLLDLQYLKKTDEISLLNPELMQVDFVELYSLSGQKIKTYGEIPTEQLVLLSIDQNLSSAVYIFKVYSDERIYSKKVIITK
ncbi:putative secreted protein (Por secretion system target) [Christiangramia gaetbulicola]|uniref:Putative secreted protein (Por secretion system target) n=1 Tax=Christiangramia gaetbulicola TaxID=703340 RepID=A0A2T6AK78_9FLAO|nr:LamG-like jellyroll fold domain-containing protein [Christiangramia gaetbulicola]PTX44229.1 putative secreted protein (Por secretion system target) [Christiangramia gaetbulicola]